MVNDEFHEIRPSTRPSQILPQITSLKGPENSEVTKRPLTTKLTTNETRKIHPTPSTASEVSHESDLNNVIETKKPSGSSRRWYK